MKGTVLTQGIITANDKRYTYDDADLKNGDVKNGDEVDFVADEETQKAHEIYKTQKTQNAFNFSANNLATIRIFGGVSTLFSTFLILALYQDWSFLGLWFLGLAGLCVAMFKLATLTGDKSYKNASLAYAVLVGLAFLSVFHFTLTLGSIRVDIFNLALLFVGLYYYEKIFKQISMLTNEKTFYASAIIYAIGLVLTFLFAGYIYNILFGITFLFHTYMWFKLDISSQKD